MVEISWITSCSVHGDGHLCGPNLVVASWRSLGELLVFSLHWNPGVGSKRGERIPLPQKDKLVIENEVKFALPFMWAATRVQGADGECAFMFIIWLTKIPYQCPWFGCQLIPDIGKFTTSISHHRSIHSIYYRIGGSKITYYLTQSSDMFKLYLLWLL